MENNFDLDIFGNKTKRKIRNINDVNEFAIQNNWICVSDSYVNSESKLNWICSNGHEFSMPMSRAKRGDRCKKCSLIGESLGEKISRFILELMHGKSFPKERPKWIQWKNNRPLELDGYCEQIRIAFEYHGSQHYREISRFPGALPLQKERDRFKVNACLNNNVKLIIIPEFNNLNDLDGCINQIELSMIQANINIPEWSKPKDILELRRPTVSFLNGSRREKLNTILFERMGKLLTDSIFISSNKLLWECAEGHQWQATYHNILKGTWCPTCSQKERNRKKLIPIDVIVEKAKSFGYKLISDNYESTKKKYMWECKFGHIWESTFDNLRTKGGCLKCSGLEKKDIKYLNAMANRKEGKCLSNEYINIGHKYTWMCKEGHIWDATANNVSNGKWCKVCNSAERKITKMKVPHAPPL